MIRKALTCGADAVVVDLEDAVTDAERPQARLSARSTLEEHKAGPGTTVFVRVSAPRSASFEADFAAALQMSVSGVVVPKLDAADATRELVRALALDGRGLKLIAGIETARGVTDSGSILSQGVDAVYFGAEDFIADVGGHRTSGNREVLFARSQVMLSARLAGVPAIDQAVVAYGDDARFREDAREGRAIGYIGKICIHPRQVAIAHEVFTPNRDEIAHAEAVVRAFAGGTGSVDGKMVDAVHLRMAEAVLRRARRLTTGRDG